jgi:periplasmic copper chaperone A
MTMKKTTFAAVAAAAALAVPATASAHVTLQPRQAVAGSFSKMDVRVPNERDNKGTIKVDVRLPDGFYFLSYQKVPGWRTRVHKEKLEQPVDLGGFQVDEQFTRIVWIAKKPKRDRIAPGQFQDFPISVRVPDGAPGTQLSFRAFQTYQGGERVAWVGAPDSEEPAPRVTLLAAEGE